MATKLLITLCGPGGGLSFREVALKTFCGKPISHYSLSAALLFLQSRQDLAADIVLNTDSGLLRETVTGLYPEVVHLQRPAALAGDVPRLEIFRHSLREMEARRETAYDYHIDLDIAHPLRRVADIEACFSKLAENSALESVFAACQTRRSPYTAYGRQAESYLAPLLPGAPPHPLPECWDLHGSVSCFRRDFLARTDGGSLWTGNCEVCDVPIYEVGGLSVTEAFPYYEMIGRQLFQNDPDYRQIRNAIR